MLMGSEVKILEREINQSQGIDHWGQWCYIENRPRWSMNERRKVRLLEDRLDKMDPDKRLRLINAAMKEFAENRFEKASTNHIVSEAGISKGLLFHYFDSKEGLFNYLVAFSMNAVATPIAEEIGCEETDIILRMEKIVQLKIKILEKYPSMLNFSKVMFAGKDLEEVKAFIAKYNPIPLEMYYSHNIDESLFLEGVSVDMAIKNIRYTLEGISDDYLNKRNMGIDIPIEVIMNEVQEFLAHFRSMYYKK